MDKSVKEKIEALKSQIGGTPLARLGDCAGVPLFAKLEWRQKGESVKMRPAFQMMTDALEAGRFDNGKRALDCSSGNTGIALATIATELGLPLTLVVPGNINPGKLAILKGLDIELILSPKEELYDGAIVMTKRMLAEKPDSYFHIDQYSNPSNPKAHVATAREIFEQTGGKVGCIVCGVGTGGSVVGTARELKKLKPDVKAVAVIPPEAFHGFEGMSSVYKVEHPSTVFLEGMKEGLVDEIIYVDTPEGYDALSDLVRVEGIFGGLSSGAVFEGARRAAEMFKTPTVAVFADCLFNYVASPLFHKKAGRQTMERDILKIYKHALEGYEGPRGQEEVCGYVVGPADDPRENIVIPIENQQNRLFESGASDRSAVNGFAIMPETEERIRREAAAKGWKVKMLYHSHVDNPGLEQKPAYFSATDKTAACPFGLDMGPSYPEMENLVVSVIEGKVYDTKSFMWSESSCDFESIEIAGPDTNFIVVRET